MNELSAIDKSALELLATARHNAELEITERAHAARDSVLADDLDLSYLSQVGADALSLYSTLEKREAYFMRNRGVPSFLGTVVAIANFSLGNYLYRDSYRRREQYYAQDIITSRDGDIDKKQAERWAEQEISRVERTRRDNEMLRQRGFKDFEARISASGYAYYSPPIALTEPEYVDGFPISQQWRVKATLPCTNNGFLRVLTTLHEFKSGTERKSTPIHTIKINDDDEVEEATAVVNGQRTALHEVQLAFPHGLLLASKDAVIASVPKRISKKW